MRKSAVKRKSPNPKAGQQSPATVIRSKGKSKARLRWTMAQAVMEFDVTEGTLRKRMTVQGVMPGDDGLYSTGQLCQAIYGGLDFERERETKARADKIERENRVAENKLLPAHWVSHAWDAVCGAIRSTITSARIPEKEKRRVLRELTEISMDDYRPPTQEETEE